MKQKYYSSKERWRLIRMNIEIGEIIVVKVPEEIVARKPYTRKGR